MKKDKFSEEERLLFSLDKNVRKAAEEYALIEEGDKILIGFSGGKDSFALVELLARRMRIFRPRFSVVAVHIVMDNIPYEANLEAMDHFCRDKGVEFVVRHTSFDATTDHRKSPCFLCSWNRRKALFECAKEFNCNKIALGHHKDDVIQTLLMNMVFQGAFSTMPPKLTMNNFEMTIIRPLVTIEEEELIHLCQLRNYPLQKKNCPYEKESHRSEMKGIVQQLVEMYPHAKSNIWGSMHNIQEEYLPGKGVISRKS